MDGGSLTDVSDEEMRELVEEAEACLRELARTVSPKKLEAIKRLLTKLREEG